MIRWALVVTVLVGISIALSTSRRGEVPLVPLAGVAAIWIGALIVVAVQRRKG